MKYKHIFLFLIILLPSTYATGAAANRQETALPDYHIPLQVNLAESSRPAEQFRAVFAEINRIWFSQAGICFDIEVVREEQETPAGLEMRFSPKIGGWNGSYDGEIILMKDHPLLNPAPHPSISAAARTAAHELGHALGLHHDQSDSDNLMASKTFGWQLNRQEIAKARQAAAGLSTTGSTSQTCP